MQQFWLDFFGGSEGNLQEVLPPVRDCRPETLLLEAEDYEIRPACLRKEPERPLTCRLEEASGPQSVKTLSAFQSLFRIEIVQSHEMFKFQLSIGERHLPVDLTAFQSSLKQTLQDIKSMFVNLPRRRLPKKGSSGAKAPTKEIPPRDWRRF